MPDVLLNTKSLAAFGAKMLAEAPEVAKEYQLGLMAAAEIIAAEARRSAAFSTRIPASIKTSRRVFSVKVSAGGDAAPDAAPLEHGGLPGSFRHPVFGNREVWVSQPAHPFLLPALEAKAEEFTAAVLVAVDVSVARMVI